MAPGTKRKTGWNAQVRRKGYTDVQAIEIVRQVAPDTWTNCVNQVFQTEIGFPAITTSLAA